MSDSWTNRNMGLPIQKADFTGSSVAADIQTIGAVSATISQVTVQANFPELLVAENPTRKALHIRVIGGGVLYLGVQGDYTISEGFPVWGGVFDITSLNLYKGALYGLADTGTLDVRLYEL